MVTHLSGLSAAQDFLQAHGTQDLATDTRALPANAAFIAWPGLAQDARRYVSAALAAGARACLVDTEGLDAFQFNDSRIGALSGLKSLAGPLAAQFFAQPSQRLSVFAVTGTNGKTSTAWWTAQALSLTGRTCGLIGTLGQGLPFSTLGQVAASLQKTGFTTPDPIMVQRSLRQFVEQGATGCALEASSIGLDEARLNGLHIEVAQFTNFTQDHLDYHGDMHTYWLAKQRLFDWPDLAAAVINLDDDQGYQLAQALSSRASPLKAHAQPEVWTYSLGQRPARLSAHNLVYQANQLCFDVVEGAQCVPFRIAAIGAYNVANLLAVLGGLRAQGISLAELAVVCQHLTGVPGRMQQVQVAGGPLAVVDYAHTPDALQQALKALRLLVQSRGGRLWVVFGCGGNRDTSKRPLMGALAEQLADQVVVTSDNPRHESPAAILAHILAGVVEHDQVAVIENRAEAIAYAVGAAQPEDVVLIAGKGHETTQECAGQVQPFSDVEQAHTALLGRSGV